MGQLDTFKKEELISEVTYQMLKRLIERKTKETAWENYRNRYGMFMLMIIYPGVLYLLYRISLEHINIFKATTIMSYITNVMVWLILFLIYASHHIWYWIDKKLKEYEDDCDDLRKEIIDRAEELFEDGMSWDMRHQIYHFLDSVYGINLYHAS